MRKCALSLMQRRREVFFLLCMNMYDVIYMYICNLLVSVESIKLILIDEKKKERTGGKKTNKQGEQGLISK